MSEVEAIRFKAQIIKISTLAAGGYRLTLDLGDDDMTAVVSLLEANQPGVLLEVAAVAVKVDGLPVA